MPGRHVRHAAPLIGARRRAPSVVTRISAVTSAGVFIMAILIGVIVEHSFAPRLGMGYGTPAVSSHSKKPTTRPTPRSTPRRHPASHAPAVKHHVASMASMPGAVRLTMLAQRGAGAAAAFGGLPAAQPFVDIVRHDGSWAFGTSAIAVPAGVTAMPDTALFLAQASGSTWKVALDGTGAFAQMLLQAPGQLLPAAEKQVLAQYNAARQAASASGASKQAGGQASPGPSATPSATSPSSGSAAQPGTATGLALPWKSGQSWTMISAPGRRPAGADPLAQASFAGGDGRVLSAGAGRLFRFCTSGGGALLEVIHADGSATEYYQIDRETTVSDGSPIAKGAYLGRTGTSLACGGASGRRDVEFSLLNSRGSGLNGTAIGGWTFSETLQPLRVWAQRGTQQILPGKPLQNLGSMIGIGGL